MTRGEGGRVDLTLWIRSIGAVDLLDASVAKRQLTHPVDAATNGATYARVVHVGSRVKSIGSEVVVTETDTWVSDRRRTTFLPEVLSIIIGRHIVDMNLIAFFEIVEK